MAKGLFANPKTALGFAGVTIAIAIGATFAAGAFIPDEEPEAEVVAEAEADPQPKPAARPVQTAWADDGLADDWGAQASDTASGPSSPASANGQDPELAQPEFGNYDQDHAAPASERPRRSSQTRSSRSEEVSESGGGGVYINPASIRPGGTPGRGAD